jgi:hypothetical protein
MFSINEEDGEGKGANKLPNYLSSLIAILLVKLLLGLDIT